MDKNKEKKIKERATTFAIPSWRRITKWGAIKNG